MNTLRSLLLMILLSVGLLLVQPAAAQGSGPGIVVEQTTQYDVLHEAGTTIGFDISLTAQPSSDVQVAVASPDGETIFNITAMPWADPLVLDFDASNWDTPQSIIVHAVDDDVIEGDHSGTVTFTASGAAEYSGLSADPVTLTIWDNDGDVPEPAVIISPTDGDTTVSEDGLTDTFTVTLSTQPSAVLLLETNPFTELEEILIQGPRDDEPSNSTELHFNPDNWNEPQIIAVTAVDDDEIEGTHQQLVEFSTLFPPFGGNFVPPGYAMEYLGVGIIDTTVNIIDNDDDPGGDELVLSAPTGTIDVPYGNPNYTWNAISGAVSYDLYVQMNRRDLDSYQGKLFEIVVNAADACSGGTCSVDTTTIDPMYRLYNGSYSVWLRARFSDTSFGEYAGPFDFTLQTAPPDLVTLQPVTGTDTLQPTFNWTLEGTAIYGSWFYVYVAPTDSLVSSVVMEYFSREQVCGSSTGTTCSLTSPVELMSGVPYSLYVLSVGPGGFMQSAGLYGFAGPETFTLDVETEPTVVTDLQISIDMGKPVLSWASDPAATAYDVYIGLENGPQAHRQTYNASTFCSAMTCTLTPEVILANGRYVVYVRAAGASGFNADETVGWGGPFPFELNYPLAAAPSNPTVTGTDTDTATFSWTGDANATYYEIWVGQVTPSINAQYNAWHNAAELGCGAGGTCSLTVNASPFPTGDFNWYVRSWGPAGFGVGGEPGVLNEWVQGPSFSR